MSTLHVGHSEIVRFADERVNLKREDVKELRDQVNRLRDRLEAYLKEHPTFSLKKMLLSGSLAKGTALKSINDIDVAVYISSKDAAGTMKELIAGLATRLRLAFPNLKHDQVKENTYTVTIQFLGTGLKVDVVPILYAGDADWKGHLVSKETGEQLLTSIPMHLEFIRRRKSENDIHYAQIIRLMKHWVKTQKSQNPNFRFKSFLIELLVSHLVDKGLKLGNYPEAMAYIFAYIATDAFRTAITFADHYDPALCVATSDAMRIWDPVNHKNNAAKLYTAAQRDAIVDAALEAGDAIDAALRAPTKSDTLRYWRKVFGSTFDA
jgi:tRNA nucleotidyltransferase (CCA-adding enzyme)